MAHEQSDREELIQRLIEAVEDLAGELSVIRTVLDEIRDEFGWAVRNDKFRSRSQPWVITSMPLDPTAKDFGKRLNRFSAKDLPPEPGPEPPAPETPGSQKEFW